MPFSWQPPHALNQTATATVETLAAPEPIGPGWQPARHPRAWADDGQSRRPIAPRGLHPRRCPVEDARLDCVQDRVPGPPSKRDGRTAIPRSSSSTRRPPSPPATAPASNAAGLMPPLSQRPGAAHTAPRRQRPPRWTVSCTQSVPSNPSDIGSASYRRTRSFASKTPTSSQLRRARLPWSFAGYGPPKDLPSDTLVEAITPFHIRAAIAAGYRPRLHPSAESQLRAR